MTPCCDFELGFELSPLTYFKGSICCLCRGPKFSEFASRTIKSENYKNDTIVHVYLCPKFLTIIAVTVEVTIKDSDSCEFK